jgi:transposase
VEAARQYTIAAGDLQGLQAKVALARKQWGLPPETRVVSCYEAGRDGFWLHRALTAAGWANRVIDPASIERDRRAKPLKTDRVDAGRLLELLVLAEEGRRRLRVVHVPSEADEDARQPDRELGTLKGVRTTIRNRITGLLATQGVRVRRSGAARPDLASVHRWDGTALPPQLAARLAREVASLAAVEARIGDLEAARAETIAAGETVAAQRMGQLMRLKAVGPNGAGRLVAEFFGWRRFRNGREVGALAGLTPTPYQSGAMAHDQGISKAGHARVRAMAIELAWCWVRFQPASALTRWYQTRFGGGSGRQRRIGIVALARKLLIAFWRFLETGVFPDGAVTKPA